jgi:6-phosphogluconolactonase
MWKGYCMNGTSILTILCMFAMMSSSWSWAATPATQFWVYFGTNSNPPSKSKGIYLSRFDAATGKITAPTLAAEIGDPGWQVIPPGGKFLFTVGTKNNHRTSTVAAFSIDPATGALTSLNEQVSKGKDTTHIDVDPAGTCAVVANYGSGDVSVLPINPDGTLSAVSAVIKHAGSSVNPDRQRHPFPHSCNFDPTGNFVLVPDLGMDKVFIYRFDAAQRTLSDASPPTVAVAPGSGPRHLSFHPNGKFAYLVNEMGGTVIAYSWDSSKGQLLPLQTVSTLPPGYHGANTSAEVRIHPNGRFLYASNRGPDDLAIFEINSAAGTLTSVGYQSVQGKAPRDFRIDPTGQFLFAANQDSDTVVIFRINPETGQLTPTGDVLNVPTPICVTFLAVK